MLLFLPSPSLDPSSVRMLLLMFCMIITVPEVRFLLCLLLCGSSSPTSPSLRLFLRCHTFGVTHYFPFINPARYPYGHTCTRHSTTVFFLTLSRAECKTFLYNNVTDSLQTLDSHCCAASHVQVEKCNVIIVIVTVSSSGYCSVTDAVAIVGK